MTATVTRSAGGSPPADRELGLAWRIVVAVIGVAGFVAALSQGFPILWYVPYAGVGALLILRRPQTAIGWILAGLGLAFVMVTMNVPASEADFADGSLSPVALLVTILGWTSGPLIFFLFGLLSIVFPSGRLPAGAWGAVARVAVVIGIVDLALNLLMPTLHVSLWASTSPTTVRNPIGLLPELPIWQVVTPDTASLPVVGLMAASVVSLFVRYRRAVGIERQQLRWIAAALVLVVFAVVGGFVAGLLVPAAAESGVVWLGAVAAFPTVPVAVGIAVLRYRLYEIDLILNRAAVYASVSALLVAMFMIGNIALQYVLESLTGQHSELLSGALGVGLGLLFLPIRRRVGPLVDRFLPARAMLALLFTDVVGSTEKIVDIGDERWRALLGRYLAVVRAELTRYGGHEVNTAGDSFFATFIRPGNALEAAWAIRSAVRQIGLETRTGLHLGEVEMRGEQVSGLAVHTAARVMAAAAGGEVLVSDAMREAIAVDGVALRDRGLHSLKGVPGDWQLYAVEVGLLGT